MDQFDVYQAMLRWNGRDFGSPRTLAPHQAEEMVQRLGAIVLFNTRTREVLYRRES